MLGPGILAKLRPAARQGARRRGSGQRPEDLRLSMTNTADAQAERERRAASADYLGYLLCAAGRLDLLTTRHLRDRLPPGMPPMC